MRTSPVCLLVAAALLPLSAAAQKAAVLPSTEAQAVDNHTVTLPRDLNPITVMIVGFSRASQDNTTAWEKPVRAQLADGARIGFYDVAVFGGMPSFMRSFIAHELRKQVPPVLQPRFVAVYTEADAWKAAAGYDRSAPDAAYVLLTDSSGHVLSRTHEPFTPERFAALAAEARAQAAHR